MTLEFRILGPLGALADGRPLPIAGARARAVLAMLLVRANRVVTADTLIQELWPEDARDGASASLRVRVSELRRLLRSAGECDRLSARRSGYVLRVERGELDAARFEALLEEGRAALTTGESTPALRRLNEALDLWRGDALSDVADAPSVRNEAARLGELRVTALAWRVDARLALGHDDELVGELEALTAAHPLRERLWLRRMIALYRAGRQAEALEAFRSIRATLADELGIEPGRELRDLELRILRQDPTLERERGEDDRRAVAHVRQTPTAPTTHYVRSGDVHIAYQVVGRGATDIVFVPGLVSHLDLWWENPTASRLLRQLASLGRLIMFDKRDTGLSDRTPGDASFDERIADMRAVLDACGSDRSVLFGLSEGGPMSMVFAAANPERTPGLILAGAAARWPSADDYPCGRESDSMLAALEQLAHDGWGRGDSVDWYSPSRSSSRHARQAYARWERMAAAPSTLLRLLAAIRKVDVRAVLPTIRTPTLILQRLDDRITPRCHGRYLAEHIAGARYFEQPGDHALWLGDTDRLFLEIEDFLTGGAPTVARSGPPATILYAEFMDPLTTAAGVEACDLIGAHGGCVRDSQPDRVVATFDGSTRAIRCAVALCDLVDPRDNAARAGIHTGAVTVIGDRIAGTSVDVVARIAALAAPGEVLVSNTVTDLVAGAGLHIAERDAFEIAGVPGRWSANTILDI